VNTAIEIYRFHIHRLLSLTVELKRSTEESGFKNHADLELEWIDALAGPAPPFAFILDRYGSPLLG